MTRDADADRNSQQMRLASVCKCMLRDASRSCDFLTGLILL